MKAKELMIGDLVYAIFDIEDENEDYITEQVPVMIIGIDENCSLGDGYSVSYIPIGDVPDECCDCFDPIPLTAEILEKNGWKTGMYSTFDLEDDKWLEYYHHEARLRKYWRGVDEWQNHAEVKEIDFQCKYIRYVHEFQHALRLCGLNELADNFKI